MRYVIVSDSHGYHTHLDEVLYSMGHVDGVFHLGDVEDRETDIEAQIDCPLFIVCGNNDSEMFLPREREVFVGEHKVFMTHGHYYHVHFGVKDLVKEAKKRGCDIAMFGHTHSPFQQVVDGVLVLNPGSVTFPRTAERRPTYMMMEVPSSGPVKVSLRYADES